MLGSSLLGPSAVRALPVRAAASHLASRRQQQHCCRRWQACAAQPDDSEFEDLPVIGQPSGRPGEGAQEALIKSLQEVSSKQGRTADRGNTLVLGSDKRLEAWRRVDKKVNKYPGQRVFKAVGEGGDNFAGSMQAAVERTLGPLPPHMIQHRLSSHQRFLSVTIGPVTVHNSDQVVEVYQTMKKDSRLKFCL